MPTCTQLVTTYYIHTQCMPRPGCALLAWSLHVVTEVQIYIVWSFRIIGLILNEFENGVPLKPVLEAWEMLQYHFNIDEQTQ